MCPLPVPSHNMGSASRKLADTSNPLIYQPWPPKAAPMCEPLAHNAKSYSISVRTSFESLDTDRIKSLLESSFGKRLVDPEKYFAAQDIVAVFVEQDYKGIAIVKKLDGHFYLDKLAVVPELKGNGLGREIWDLMTSKLATLIWRAVNDNPKLDKWYQERSDWHVASGDWIVYGYGIEHDAARGMVEKVGELPKTLLKIE